ncbi:MAG TPA: helix-turn-helix transcriptional regulator [Gaiellaceae bacterium]|nr:helix-turn-helix transcriptional regulator [Gaiellaceae bacterium]
MGDLLDAPPLSPRQREVLGLLADGLGPEAIAIRLGLSLPTVRNHVSAVLRRLGCHSQLEAVAAARRRGLI